MYRCTNSHIHTHTLSHTFACILIFLHNHRFIVRESSLKHHSLSPPTDIDYCSLNLEQCPPHSICLRHSPGNYSCTCLPPWIPTHDHTCALDLVHIILSTDTEQLPGLIGVIDSTLNHAQHSEQIVFHIVFTGERLVIESYLSCYGYNDYPQIDITIFNASLITEPIQVYSRISEVGHLASPGNFARFYFHLLFPELSRAVYLDVDTVVLGDVAEVWSKLRTADTLLVAAPRLGLLSQWLLEVYLQWNPS